MEREAVQTRKLLTFCLAGIELWRCLGRASYTRQEYPLTSQRHPASHHFGHLKAKGIAQ